MQVSCSTKNNHSETALQKLEKKVILEKDALRQAEKSKVSALEAKIAAREEQLRNLSKERSALLVNR